MRSCHAKWHLKKDHPQAATKEARSGCHSSTRTGSTLPFSLTKHRIPRTRSLQRRSRTPTSKIPNRTQAIKTPSRMPANRIPSRKNQSKLRRNPKKPRHKHLLLLLLLRLRPLRRTIPNSVVNKRQVTQVTHLWQIILNRTYRYL